jgi:hypothetical protein
MLVQPGDVNRPSRRKGSVKPEEEREVPVNRHEPPKPVRSRESQAPSLEETHWWMQNPETPIRNHKKRGRRTLPNLDKL